MKKIIIITIIIIIIIITIIIISFNFPMQEYVYFFVPRPP